MNPILSYILIVLVSGIPAPARADPIEDVGNENGGKLSINSPRKESRGIFVKLPDNVEDRVNWRPKDKAIMLGFPAGFPPSSPIPTTTLRSKVHHPKQVAVDSRRVTVLSTTTTTQKPDDKPVEKPDYVDKTAWAIAWEAHVYFSGTLFVLLAIYCTVNMARLHSFSRLFSRGYFVALNLSLILMGIIRPVWLFHDPYNAGLTWPRMAAYMLVDTGYPCMTTAFAILFLALLRATNIELISPAFQTPKALGTFCFLHFVLTWAVDATIGIKFKLRYMVLILQGVFIVWSLLLSAGYFYIFSAMNK